MNIRVVLAATALSLLAANAQATDSSWQCGHKIVRIGDTKRDVLTKCGEPKLKEEISSKDERRVEEWIYKPKSRQLIRVLTFRGRSLVKIETVTNTKEFVRQEYARKTPIPDRTAGSMPTTTEREFYFTEVDPVAGIEVSLDLTHAYVGDLRITLAGPDNSEALLHNRVGRSSADIRATYTKYNTPNLMVFVGNSARGSWKLKITDLQEGDEGSLNYWSLKLDFDDIKNVQPVR